MSAVITEADKPKGGQAADQKKTNLAALSLGAVGVVFGDIGTSPLYAMDQCFKDLHAKADPASVLGILSLIFWALILMVCVKYATFIMRADHDGEGGTLAMLALIRSKRGNPRPASPGALVLLVLAGSALLYGDGIITPAISVLSAVEGLKIAAPSAERFIVPVSVAILAGLFLLQSRGTGAVGKLFGPIMTLWFLAIAALGVGGIIHAPKVLHALNPFSGVEFVLRHGWTGILVLGGVVLAFTGAEALFADMSHFGRPPILLSWYGLVLPALVLNYFGEGALLLAHSGGKSTPFFALVPHPLLWPAVILATLATIIASQALISGVFTLTEQAIHMGYLPRFQIDHTSEEQRGQVYIATVNYTLMLACIGVVLGFRSSDKLGGAYGLAVIGTMMVTSMTFYVVLREVWHWPKPRAVFLTAFFLVLDTSFLAGNVIKIVSGAWLPLVFGGLVFAIFWVWTECGSHLRAALDAWGMPLEEFRHEMAGWGERQEGTGIFLTRQQDAIPLVGRNKWLRNVARHEQVLLITILEKEVPYIPAEQMEKVEDLGNGLWRVTASFGFMQRPNVTRILKALPQEKIKLDWDKLVCYLPEPIFEPRGSWWRRRIGQFYEFLRHNSLPVALYFHVPPRSVVLVGVQLKV